MENTTFARASEALFTLTCRICCKRFSTRNAQSLYCSQSCNTKAYRLRQRPLLPKKCAFAECGKEFLPETHRLIYCSREHMRRAVALRHAAKKKETNEPKWAARQCDRCGREFQPEGQPFQRYCGAECRTLSNNSKRDKQVRRVYGRQHYAENRDKILARRKTPEWLASHRPKLREAERRWRAKHKTEIEIRTATRLAAKHGLRVVETGKMGRPRKR